MIIAYFLLQAQEYLRTLEQSVPRSLRSNVDLVESATARLRQFEENLHLTTELSHILQRLHISDPGFVRPQLPNLDATQLPELPLIQGLDVQLNQIARELQEHDQQQVNDLSL